MSVRDKITYRGGSRSASNNGRGKRKKLMRHTVV